MPETTEFTLKKSKRAKHIRLTVNSTGQLIVVVPHTFDLDYLPTILEKKKSWIEKSLNNFKVYSDDSTTQNTSIPDTIELKAISTIFRVNVVPAQNLPATETQSRLFSSDTIFQNDTFTNRRHPDPVGKVKIKELPNNTLVINAAYGQTEEVLTKINSWLTIKAKQVLIPWLLGLAEEREMIVNSVAIRSQRTRWGSCSSTGKISLNKVLLFLPPDLVNHIMLHELCHIKEMNHSKRFWELLAAEDRNAQLAKSRLKKGWQLVPPWAIGS
ncbi:MAG: M48 family metallopeptidase [Firmicutes bacterium]|jgi:hypothetical protein|nr:M48 family metallopeptidase [Bacillota bacterium]